MVKLEYLAGAALLFANCALAQNAAPVITSKFPDPDFIRAVDGT
jgi:hypothetical protein